MRSRSRLGADGSRVVVRLDGRAWPLRGRVIVRRMQRIGWTASKLTCDSMEYCYCCIGRQVVLGPRLCLALSGSWIFIDQEEP